MGKMNRMILLYTLILSMVSLPTSLPKRFLVETADKGGDDYSNPPSIPPLEFRKKYGTTDSAEQRNNLNMPAASRIKQPAASRKLYEENKGEDYGRYYGVDNWTLMVESLIPAYSYMSTCV